mgnify:CR=1 FL=1|jgi:hypothetical protein
MQINSASPLKNEVISKVRKSERLGQFKDDNGYLPINLPFKTDKDKKKSRRPNIAYEEEVNSGDGDSQLLPNTRPESSKKQSLIKLQRTPSMAVDEEKI